MHLQRGRAGFDPWGGKIPWRRERLPTPVFWPAEFHGLYSPRGHKESDTTEQISLALSYIIEAEASILWPPYVNSQLIGKYPDVGKD